MMKKTVITITSLSMLSIGLALSGCGSGGGEVSTQISSISDGETLSSQIVSGTVSAGAPLAGQVSIKDASATPQVKTTVIGNDGSFAFDVSDMTAPYILQAKGSVDGKEYSLHSYAEGPGDVSVSPLSNAVLASAAEVEDPEDAYEKSDSPTHSKIRLNLSRTVDTILIKLQVLIERYSADHTRPITSRYIIRHLDLDDMFDNVKITVTNGILSIINSKTGSVIYTGKITDIANGNFYPDNVPPAIAVPTAPVGVTAAGGSGQMTLAWTSVSDATSYNIYYSTTPGVTRANGTKIPAPTNSYIQTGLPAGATYYYIITALNSAGESVASAEVSAVTNPAPPVPAVPAVPTGVKAVGGTKQTTVSWSAVSGATSYNIYWSTASGVTTTNGTKIAGATSPTVHTGRSDSTSYYYIVTAVNSAGESAASVQVAATTLSPVPAPTAPAAPTGVSAAGGANRVTISWTAVSGATSYNLYWSNTAGVTTTTGTRIAGVSSPYAHTSLSAGATYYYVVTAVNSVGESVASIQASATTNPPPPAVPVAPTGVTATGGANQVSVSWTPVTGATSYNLYWSRTSGVTTATGTKVTGATSPYVQTGLTAGTAYYYIVTAVNTSGEGAASAQVTGTTNAAPTSTCNTCHGVPPTTGEHTFHRNYSCGSCHGSGYSATTVNSTTHINGTVNIASGAGWNATARSCTPACHGLKNWGI